LEVIPMASDGATPPSAHKDRARTTERAREEQPRFPTAEPSDPGPRPGSWSCLRHRERLRLDRRPYREPSCKLSGFPEILLRLTRKSDARARDDYGRLNAPDDIGAPAMDVGALAGVFTARGSVSPALCTTGASFRNATLPSACCGSGL